MEPSWGLGDQRSRSWSLRSPVTNRQVRCRIEKAAQWSHSHIREWETLVRPTKRLQPDANLRFAPVGAAEPQQRSAP